MSHSYTRLKAEAWDAVVVRTGGRFEMADVIAEIEGRLSGADLAHEAAVGLAQEEDRRRRHLAEPETAQLSYLRGDPTTLEGAFAIGEGQRVRKGDATRPDLITHAAFDLENTARVNAKSAVKQRAIAEAIVRLPNDTVTLADVFEANP